MPEPLIPNGVPWKIGERPLFLAEIGERPLFPYSDYCLYTVPCCMTNSTASSA